MDKTFAELVYGPEVARQLAAFEECMAAVEARHEAFFRTTQSKYAPDGDDQPATLGEFYIHQYNAHSSSISIEPELPEHIAAECRACFAKCFGPSAPEQI
ncbi:hypothetical protein [Hymenobacter weizhouensis]|uniref:hypothetical protein n=1 Tax=Hymenobacter sp. YIM 151500-1 TaxID=2987689 RepID=UPI00222664EE|nr:hypothetical protein [Hymenobacter sp. YIM 151500-1]UYZ64918.1 hypothetical protein OIS53_08710 [Hymenobacter sp. YIM 151500-1]